MSAHAFIAGTGRAGTSFLVEFLHECGLDVGDLDSLMYFRDADAGLEHHPLGEDLPYVVKNPLLHELMGRIDLDTIQIDALIVPVRDLRRAAMSRVLRERSEMAQTTDDSGDFTTFGRTPGGVVYSLSVDDQERLLAVGQARLICWALEHEIPLYLLSFPRLIDDAAYAVDTLWPWLSGFCVRDDAIAAHVRTAAPDRVSFREPPTTEEPPSVEQLQLEKAALERAVAQLRRQVADPEAALHFEVGVVMRLKALGAAVSDLSSRVDQISDRQVALLSETQRRR